MVSDELWTLSWQRF